MLMTVNLPRYMCVLKIIKIACKNDTVHHSTLNSETPQYRIDTTVLGVLHGVKTSD